MSNGLAIEKCRKYDNVKIEHTSSVIILFEKGQLPSLRVARCYYPNSTTWPKSHGIIILVQLIFQHKLT